MVNRAWKTPEPAQKKASAFQEADAFVGYGKESPYIFVRNHNNVIRFLRFVKAFFIDPGQVLTGGP